MNAVQVELLCGASRADGHCANQPLARLVVKEGSRTPAAALGHIRDSAGSSVGRGHPRPVAAKLINSVANFMIDQILFDLLLFCAHSRAALCYSCHFSHQC